MPPIAGLDSISPVLDSKCAKIASKLYKFDSEQIGLVLFILIIGDNARYLSPNIERKSAHKPISFLLLFIVLKWPPVYFAKDSYHNWNK
ncbi:hypothetical protein GCM10011409_36940 [Lentibacillus populi]|uniref:Uncharacterized protein n=1 Tax=Lentibacillus populi TaxID=1827502 RepID=A0A9W5U0J2_9BACI|nr:hypothetical protein GCM10011409_36940 [Lentibacillus populi]